MLVAYEGYNALKSVFTKSDLTHNYFIPTYLKAV